MKVLLIQSASEHQENWHFREAQCFKRAFERLGIFAEVWGPGYPFFTVDFKIFSANFDAVIVLENYGDDWLPDLSALTIPKLLWIIDSHKVAEGIKAYSVKNKIDVNLVAWKNHLDLFNNPVWFPPCYPSDLIAPYEDNPKAHKVGFCGSRGNRGDWLDRLTNDVGLKQNIFVLGAGMIRCINSYDIHFNKNETPDVLAFRTFETLGCGTFLLTDDSGNVLDLFEDGRHLCVYSSYEDCLLKIKHYLEHRDERERIAALGHDLVKRKHTYDVRAAYVLKILMELRP